MKAGSVFGRGHLLHLLVLLAALLGLLAPAWADVVRDGDLPEWAAGAVVYAPSGSMPGAIYRYDPSGWCRATCADRAGACQ